MKTGCGVRTRALPGQCKALHAHTACGAISPITSHINTTRRPTTSIPHPDMLKPARHEQLYETMIRALSRDTASIAEVLRECPVKPDAFTYGNKLNMRELVD